MLSELSDKFVVAVWFLFVFIVNDFPDGVFSNEKAKRILAWEPHDELTPYFTRSRM